MIQKPIDGLWDLSSSALVFFVARQVFLKSCKVMFLLHSNLSLHKIQIIDFQGPAKCGPCLYNQLYPFCLPKGASLLYTSCLFLSYPVRGPQLTCRSFVRPSSSTLASLMFTRPSVLFIVPGYFKPLTM